MAMASFSNIFARKPRPRVLYAVFGLAFCVITYTAIWKDSEITGSGGGGLRQEHRQLSFLSFADHKHVGIFQSSPEFTALIHPSQINGLTHNSMLRYDPKNSDDSLCDDVLLFMPHKFAHLGHGAQLNSYLLAAMIAAYTNKAMIVLDAPRRATEFKSFSQFGCPADGWMENKDWNLAKYPNGLERLVKHPDWLDSKCAIPCQSTYNYESWDEIRSSRKDSVYYPKLYGPNEVECMNDNRRRTKVLVVGGEETKDYFEGYFKDRMVERPSKDDTYGWAMRMGANSKEAEKFMGIEGERNIFDYVSALIAKSAVLRFQPWIARDVEIHMNEHSSKFPLDKSYDVIHVRRGNIQEENSRRLVEEYWASQGKEGTDFVPFAHYLNQYDASECDDNVHLVYVSTDDPQKVKEEIATLPTTVHNTVTYTKVGCHRFQFVFSENENFESFGTDGPADDDCAGRYASTIASVADLMIAAKADRFVGELNSNWGRLVRIFRMKLNKDVSGDGGDSPDVVVRAMKVAWGKKDPLPPGM